MGVREVVRSCWYHHWAKVVLCDWTCGDITMVAWGHSVVMIRLRFDVLIRYVGGQAGVVIILMKEVIEEGSEWVAYKVMGIWRVGE